MMTDNGLFLTRSINDGVSWQGPVKLQNPVAEGQTQLAHFTVGATTQIGVAAAEDGDDSAISNYLFYRIDQTDANWANVVYASGTLTLGTSPIAGDTVTVGGQTYTFLAPEPGPDNGVAIVPLDPAATLANLVAAINLDNNFEGIGYGAATTANHSPSAILSPATWPTSPPDIAGRPEML